jgi:hypothetical protein
LAPVTLCKSFMIRFSIHDGRELGYRTLCAQQSPLLATLAVDLDELETIELQAAKIKSNLIVSVMTARNGDEVTVERPF